MSQATIGKWAKIWRFGFLQPSPSLTVNDLFRGKTPEEWRRLYAQTFDWGADVGREILGERFDEIALVPTPAVAE